MPNVHERHATWFGRGQHKWLLAKPRCAVAFGLCGLCQAGDLWAKHGRLEPPPPAPSKKELAELKQMKREGLQSDSIDREIAALESGVDAGPAELAECERRLSGLRKELARVKNNSWGSRAAVPYEDLTSTWAELVAGNGIVIYRIDFDK